MKKVLTSCVYVMYLYDVFFQSIVFTSLLSHHQVKKITVINLFVHSNRYCYFFFSKVMATYLSITGTHDSLQYTCGIFAWIAMASSHLIENKSNLLSPSKSVKCGCQQLSVPPSFSFSFSPYPYIMEYYEFEIFEILFKIFFNYNRCISENKKNVKF